MAQWRTSSTHDSIHIGVIGRCFNVHLTYQIHGANASSPLFPKGQPIRLVETSYERCQGMMILQRKKEARINSMKNPRRASVRAETRTYGTDSPSRSKSCTLSITPSSKKRWLDDGLQAHMIRSTWESSEDVSTHTWHSKSMVQYEIPFVPQRATNQIGWDT